MVNPLDFKLPFFVHSEHLEDHLQATGRTIAYPIGLTVTHLRHSGLNDEGLFRISPKQIKLDKVKIFPNYFYCRVLDFDSEPIRFKLWSNRKVYSSHWIVLLSHSNQVSLCKICLDRDLLLVVSVRKQ